MLVFEHIDQDLARYLEKVPSPGMGPDRIRVGTTSSSPGMGPDRIRVGIKESTPPLPHGLGNHRKSEFKFSKLEVTVTTNKSWKIKNSNDECF